MAVTANQTVKRQDGCRGSFPAAASTNFYGGTFAFVNASGYADDDVASGVNKFAGVVIDQEDNSSGSAADLDVEVWRDGIFELTGTGFSQATVGLDIFATDNYTVATSSAAGVRIGKCVGYVSSTKILVAIEPDSDPATVGGFASLDLKVAGVTQATLKANNLEVGDAADTVANSVEVFDGGTEKPGMLVLYNHAGVPFYIWVDNTGDLRIHTAVPTNEDADGAIVGVQS